VLTCCLVDVSVHASMQPKFKRTQLGSKRTFLLFDERPHAALLVWWDRYAILCPEALHHSGSSEATAGCGAGSSSLSPAATASAHDNTAASAAAGSRASMSPASGRGEPGGFNVATDLLLDLGPDEFGAQSPPTLLRLLSGTRVQRLLPPALKEFVGTSRTAATSMTFTTAPDGSHLCAHLMC
jgi:hypothetical protein